MGTKHSMICPICNYEVFTSAGSDRGFRIWTNTYCCVDCKNIMDLVIVRGEFRLMTEGGPEPDKIREDQQCENCEGTNLELWDSVNKPCPKCGTKLKIDPNGMTMNWD